MKFLPGTLVVKKAGGPVMLVIDEETYEWIEHGKYVYSILPQSDLISLSDYMILSLDKKKILK